MVRNRKLGDLVPLEAGGSLRDLQELYPSRA